MDSILYYKTSFLRIPILKPHEGSGFIYPQLGEMLHPWNERGTLWNLIETLEADINLQLPYI